MKVRDLMTRDAKCIEPNATLRDTAKQMRELNVGSLPVCDDDRLVGMITDRDITIRAIAEGADPEQTRVRDCMTVGIQYCFEDQSIAEAALIMQEHQLRRLVVLNGDKRMTGVLALGDLANQAETKGLVTETLESVSADR